MVSVTKQQAMQDEKKEKSTQEDLCFKIKKEAVFKALEAGETVILNGTLSPRLRQELAPLFSDNPYLEFNNKRIKIPGRLIVVEPKSSQKSLLNSISCDFTAEDYAKDLLHSSQRKLVTKREQKLVANLLLFFKAAQYPHRGRAMPENLGMTWQRLLHMKHVLLYRDKKLHSHNPIKGLMLDDYTKDSEYYAFLNVLSKFLFDEDSHHTPIRLEKYNNLLHSIEKSRADNKGYAWRLLNTCNGTTLRSLLGKNWLKDALKEASAIPLANTWTSASWKIVFEKLQSTYKSSLPLFSSTPPDKKSKISGQLEDTHQYKKMEDRLAYLIDQDPITKVIVIKGDPGVGKTHFLQ